MRARTAVRWDWATEIATVLMLDCTCVCLSVTSAESFCTSPSREGLIY